MENQFSPTGGQISACHAKPWAGPETPAASFPVVDVSTPTFTDAVQTLAHPDPALWSWGLKFLRNCTSARAGVNMDRILRVALYSRAVLKALRQHTNIQYDQVTSGILHIYRSAAEFAEARKHRGRHLAVRRHAAGCPEPSRRNAWRSSPRSLMRRNTIWWAACR